MAPDDDSNTSFPLDFDDEDEFLRAWDEAEAGAVDLLRRSLAKVVGEAPSRGAGCRRRTSAGRH
jgi:hypothetical protein